MGVSVNKKRACPHLPPLHQTGIAVRPMARPAAILENTTVEPSCRPTDGARLPRADSPATGKQTRPLEKGPKRSPQPGVPPSRWERCLRWASPTGLPTRGNPTRSRVGGGQNVRMFSERHARWRARLLQVGPSDSVGDRRTARSERLSHTGRRRRTEVSELCCVSNGFRYRRSLDRGVSC